MSNSNGQKPYLNPYLMGTVMGVLLFVTFILTSGGFGASAGLSRLFIAFTDLIAPSHIDSVGFFAMIGGGDKSSLNHPSFYFLLGTFGGGMLSAFLNGRLKKQVIKGKNISDRTRLIFALVGGLLVGYGAQFARGCTSGLALSSGALLSVGAWVFMISVFIGGYALAYFVKKLWN